MAAKSCLIRCLNSDSPAASLNEYLGQLASIGWTNQAIAEVEEMVLESFDLARQQSRTAADDESMFAVAASRGSDV
jgi:hypothetical protein